MENQMNKKELKLYHIDKKYIRDLSNVDDNVMSVSPQKDKETRPFFGIVILFNEKNYCIPLTSPNKDKFKKKSNVDFIKIFKPAPENTPTNDLKVIGILNINNMIPVHSSVMEEMDLTIHKNDTPSVKAHKELMIDQLDWCRKNIDTIQNRANKVYKMVTETPDKSKQLTRRCCKFQKLEEILDVYLGKKQETDIATPQKGKTLNKDNNPFRPKKLKEQQKNIDTKYQNQNKNQNKQKKKRHSH